LVVVEVAVQMEALYLLGEQMRVLEDEMGQVIQTITELQVQVILEVAVVVVASMLHQAAVQVVLACLLLNTI
jgi:hypothetical protein